MTLLDLWHIIKKHLIVVIALPILAFIVTFMYTTLFLPNTYTTSVSMYVMTKTNDGVITSSDLSASQMLTNDVAQLIIGDRVKSETARELHVADLDAYKFDVSSQTTTRVITLHVTGTDPEKIALVANTLVKNASQVAQEVMNIESINVMDAAVVPTKPSGPNRLSYSSVAALGALFVLISLFVLKDSMSSKIRNAEEAKELTELPILASFPLIK